MYSCTNITRIRNENNHLHTHHCSCFPFQSGCDGESKINDMLKVKVFFEKLNRLLWPGWNDDEPEITCDQARASGRAWGVIWVVLIAVVLSILLGSCHKEWHPQLTGKIKVEERKCEMGQHSFDGNKIDLRTTDMDQVVHYGWRVQMGDGILHRSLPQGCELDWNKLCGRDFSTLLNSETNSLMWGWRVVGERLEFAPYWHDDNGNKFHPIGASSEIPVYAMTNLYQPVFVTLSVHPGEQFATWRLFIDEGANGIHLVMDYYTELDGVQFGNESRMTNPWFGGNCVCPNDIYLTFSVLSDRQAEQIIK